jgi:death-on-curing protein
MAIREQAELAAAYAYGIARNHPFIDGNKRTAAVIAETFLMLNGYALGRHRRRAGRRLPRAGGGELSEEETAEWFRENLAER